MLQSQEQLQIKSQSRILTLETIAFQNLGRFCLALKNYDLTIQCLEQFRLIVKKLKNCRVEHKLILILANLYYYQGEECFTKSNVLLALQSWLKCLSFREEIEDIQLEMQVLKALGNAYNYSFYNRIKAIEYFKESLKIA
jgi:tetratricopeptide (TPR) repeat protein